MAKRRSSQATWDAEAYILRGQHCPPAAIRETLQDAMHALGANQMVHIAFHDQGIIGSLSFTLGYPKLLGDKVDGLLARAHDQINEGSLVNECMQIVAGVRSESFLSAEQVHKLVASVARLDTRRSILSAAEIESFTEMVQSGMYLTHTGRGSESPALGDIQSLMLLDIAPVSKSLLHESGLSHTLAVQLKSTAEGSALSDTTVMRIVGDRLHYDREAGAEAPFPETVDHALALAIEVTNSEAGAIYSHSASTGQPFELLASSGSEDFPSSIAREEAGVLTSAVLQNIAIQRSHWPFPEHPSADWCHPTGASLVSPIGGPGINPWRSPVGAIVICRNGQNDAFSAYDLALVRNVALRISLARTTYTMRRIGEVTSALRANTDWAKMIDNLRNKPAEQFEPQGLILPADVRVASERVAAFLQGLAEVTDSQSISMRIALPSERATQPHGLALVRVASYPEASSGTVLEVQTEDDRGFNWRCMKTGEPVYAARVSDHSEDYLLVRPSTISELTVPIRLGGSVVGVLNLESSLYDAYDTVQPLILSFSGAVARTLADARAALEQRVIDRAAQALNHRHTMDSQLDVLQKEIDGLGLSGSQHVSLTTKVAALKTELDAIRRVKFVEEENASTMPQILERAAEKVSYLGDLPAEIRDPRFSVTIAGDRATALEVSISNILSNLMNYTGTSVDEAGGRPLREIAMSLGSLGGSENIILQFQNFANGYVDARRIADLYRWPIQGNAGRLRIGGFLAGLSARRANARLQAIVLSDRRTVRTTLIVPIER
jgi:GAF domain-containing protein